jgi:hypothetical protein
VALASHDQSRPLEEFKCALCVSKFTSKFDLMSHERKNMGKKSHNVKNERNGFCQYGPKFCWFIHTDLDKISENDSENVNQNDTKEIIKKLFDMMEHFARRLLEIENSS